MRRKTVLVAILLGGILILSFASPLWPEARGESTDGLRQSSFTTRAGQVSLYLPEDLLAGDTLSGRVEVKPAGSTPAERERNRAELNGYVLEVDQESTPVERGALRLQIRQALAGAGGLVALRLRDGRGRALGEASLPVAAGTAPGSANGFSAPPAGQAGRPVRLSGPFDADFATTEVAVGGQPAEVLCESSRGAWARTPAGVVGPTEIAIRERGNETRQPYRSLGVDLAADRTALQPNQRSRMTVTVRGLEGLEKPLAGRLVNLTPAVVDVEGGVEQVLVISPEEVRNGGFQTDRELTGRATGAFNVRFTLVQPLLAVQDPSWTERLNEWLCDDCARECRKNAEACGAVGNTKFTDEQKVGKEVPTTTGDLWQKYTHVLWECTKKTCYWTTLYCCEYTRWENKGNRSFWRVKRKGAEGFALPEAAIPCDCGTLIDILSWVGLAGFTEKNDMLAYQAAAKGCKLLTKDNVESMAKACGLAEMREQAFALKGDDFVKWMMRLIGGLKPADVPTPN